MKMLIIHLISCIFGACLTSCIYPAVPSLHSLFPLLVTVLLKTLLGHIELIHNNLLPVTPSVTVIHS